MMLARQALLGGVGEHLAHHAAQRVLGQDVVADVIDGHGFKCLRAAFHGGGGAA